MQQPLKINHLVKTIAATSMSIAIATSAYAVSIDNDGNNRSVGNVRWNMQAEIDPQTLIAKPVPQNETSLFFIRRYDTDPEQSSANIAVNDRFQVSLQPGSYTQVYSCAGINDLTAVPTGEKTNDLLQSPYRYNLAAQGTYFFFVDFDAQGGAEIQQITQETALQALANKKYQTHQITRVVPNCPTVVPLVPAQTPPPALNLTPPVLERPQAIELEILFDNDKAVIKPQYFAKVQEVADFMKRYPNTTAVIEGHTDSNADDLYNLGLSERRAIAVKDMMNLQFGIDPSRLTTIGYGESKPRASNNTAEGRALNRRVIATITQKNP